MKFAAIDIGTNAARLLIGEVSQQEGRKYIIKHSYTRIPLRLGVEVFENGIISESKAEEFKKAMQAFKLIAEIFDVSDIRVCATSAMREAKNAIEIQKFIEKSSGLNIEIISGHEEASLIFSTFSLLRSKKNNAAFVVIDVGGGSTEISVFENDQRVASKSFKIGTLRILKKKVSPSIWNNINEWIENNVDTTKIHEVYGTGGNINKAHKILGGKFLEPISLIKLESLKEELQKLSLKERVNQYQLKIDRADVLVPALNIYLEILKKLAGNELLVPKIGLSDGMIYDMYLKHKEEVI